MFENYTHPSVLKDTSYYVSLSLCRNALTQYFGWIPASKLFLRKKTFPVLTFSVRVVTHTTLHLNFFDFPLVWFLMVTNSCTNGACSSYSASFNLGGSTSVTGNVGPCGVDKLGVVWVIS